MGLFRQVVEHDPKNGEALLYLAGALASGGRPADALPYFERALDAGPRSTMALNGLGLTRLATGDRTRGRCRLPRVAAPGSEAGGRQPDARRAAVTDTLRLGGVSHELRNTSRSRLQIFAGRRAGTCLSSVLRPGKRDAVAQTEDVPGRHQLYKCVVRNSLRNFSFGS